MLNGKICVEKDRRYDIGETCEILDMSRKTLRKYTRAGQISFIVHGPTGKMFYLGKEIERFYKCTI